MPDLAMPITAEVFSDEDNALHAELASALSKSATTPATVANTSIEPVFVSVDFRRSMGKCTMFVDARPFHAYLDRLGVPHDNFQYTDQPYCSYRTVDTGSHKISPAALLLRAKNPDGTSKPVELNLLDVYRTPPTAMVLTKIGESVEDVLTQIIEHYRPVEIAVRIHAKGGAK